jgi:hypothetical protein
LARGRREKDIDRYRQLERLRQKRRRLAQAKAKGTGQGPDRQAVSRAGLAPQVSILLEDTLRIWDRAVAVSRAGLQRELVQALRLAARIVDEPEQGA